VRPALLLWIAGVPLVGVLALTLRLGKGPAFFGLVSGAVIVLVVAAFAFAHVFITLLAVALAIVVPRRWISSTCPDCGDRALPKLARAFAPGSSAADGKACRLEWRCFACGWTLRGTTADRRRLTAAPS
jgi:hypothetical protein